jgi:hypothetical protein
MDERNIEKIHFKHALAFAIPKVAKGIAVWKCNKFSCQQTGADFPVKLGSVTADYSGWL